MFSIWKNWFYWRTPKRTIKRFFRNIKWSIQRVRRGWADCDAWDLDHTFLCGGAEMLEYLAAHTHTYPDAYGSYENWCAELCHIAQLMRTTYKSTFDWNYKAIDSTTHNADLNHQLYTICDWFYVNLFDLWD